MSCWSLFVNDICRQLSTGQHVSINSNPNLRRDFVPISLVLNFFLSLVPNNNFTNLAFACNIINLCSQHTLSLSDMANRASTVYSKIYFV